MYAFSRPLILHIGNPLKAYKCTIEGINENEEEKGKFDLQKGGILPFLNSKSKVLLLYAQGGSGKSVFMQRLEQEMMNEYKGLKNWFPIYIQLGSINNSLSEYIPKKIT